MQPSFPSLTFPNHYTIVTGLYPSHHGLVANSYYNRQQQGMYTMRSIDKVTNGKYYGGTPLWVLAEQQQMLSASFYWVGSEADIQGTRPTYYYRYNEQITLDNRIQTVVNWLNLPVETRPHLITFYFPEVDHAGHSFGSNSVEVRNAVHWVDSAILKLTRAIDALHLDVNFILVSDHGMTQIDTRHPIPLQIDTTRFITAFSSEIVHLYARDPQYIQPYYEQLKSAAKDYKVYLKKEVPTSWHYNAQNDVDDHIGDIVLVPKWPQVFSISGRTPSAGSHGFDPQRITDMRAIFYAWGPAFKNRNIGPVKNIDVYPVVADILGLRYNHSIDGSEQLARRILHSEKKPKTKTRRSRKQNANQKER
jgi:predicted AlkP superfamily pyrophosphatase or phosphodiesterase